MARQLSFPFEQQDPIPNSGPRVWDLVIVDMMERDNIGFTKYGTHLQPDNGRDGLRDLYEELLDASVYIRQLMFERDGK